MQRYNLNSQQTVYIGDSTFDVEMAQHAGKNSSAAVTWGAHDARSLLHSNPDFIINDPSEINTCIIKFVKTENTMVKIHIYKY